MPVRARAPARRGVTRVRSAGAHGLGACAAPIGLYRQYALQMGIRQMLLQHDFLAVRPIRRQRASGVAGIVEYHEGLRTGHQHVHAQVKLASIEQQRIPNVLLDDELRAGAASTSRLAGAVATVRCRTLGGALADAGWHQLSALSKASRASSRTSRMPRPPEPDAGLTIQ